MGPKSGSLIVIESGFAGRDGETSVDGSDFGSKVVVGDKLSGAIVFTVKYIPTNMHVVTTRPMMIFKVKFITCEIEKVCF